jgi:hypothetical protein
LIFKCCFVLACADLLLEAAEELIKGALDGGLHNQLRDCGDFACLFGMGTIIQIAAESGPAQKNRL